MKERSLKTKLLLPFIALEFFIILVAFIWSYYESWRQQKFFFIQKNSFLRKNLNKFEELSRIAVQDAILLSECKRIIEAFKARDREKLSKVTYKFLNELEMVLPYRYYVHYHFPHAISFLRLWKPNKYGDDISSFRRMIVDVQRSKRPVWGIELGRMGLAIRGIAPILDGDRLLGSVEVFFDMGEVLRKNTPVNPGFSQGIYIVSQLNLFASPYKSIKKKESGLIAWKPLSQTCEKLLPSSFFRDALSMPVHLIKGKFLFVSIPVYDYSKEPVGVYVGCFLCPSFFTKNLLYSLFTVCLILFPVTLFYFYLINTEIISPIRLLNANLNIVDRIIGQHLMLFFKELKMEEFIRGTNKEIALLANQVYKIIEKLRSLITFRHYIEQEKNIAEVYERLKILLTQKFKLQNFVIYEVSNSKNKMYKVVEVFRDPIFKEFVFCPDVPENCECVRVGGVVCNLIPEEMCRYMKEDICYLCIPIKGEGNLIGIVMFLFRECDESLKDLVIYQVVPYLEIAFSVITVKKYAEILKKAALHDYLTGLYNRRVLEDFITHFEALALRQRKKVGVLMLDLDHFKQINDIYGHRAGDEVLRQVALIIKNNLRKSDIAIRYGGEEILLLLNDIQKDSLFDTAEKIRKTVAKTEIFYEDKVIKVTVSIGAALFSDVGSRLEETIKYADKALYEAKSLGRNKVVIFSK